MRERHHTCGQWSSRTWAPTAFASLLCLSLLCLVSAVVAASAASPGALVRYGTPVYHNGHRVLWHGAWRDGAGGKHTETASAAEPKAGGFSIVVDDSDATCGRAAADLARVVGSSVSGAKLVTIAGKVSRASLMQAARSHSADFALIPVDALLDPRAQSVRPQDLSAKAPLVARLFAEDIAVIAPRNVTDIHQLAEKRVSIGAASGESATTAGLVFSELKVAPAFVNYELADGLARLARGEIDAVFVVGGQGDKNLSEFGADGRFHILSIPADPSLLSIYYPAHLQAADWPHLIGPAESADTLSVGIALLALDAPAASRRAGDIAPVVDGLFDHFDQLADGASSGGAESAEWSDVNLGARFEQWPRLKSAQDWLDRKTAGGASAPQDVRVITTAARSAGTALSSADADRLYADYLRWTGANP
jgi:TRAP-type uncharacterized transport system substrate-binding protein